MSFNGPVVSIADYGCGNIKSLVNALRKVGANATIASNPDQLSEADLIILPGVGAFSQAMEQLKTRGYIEALEHEVFTNGKRVLGICLGMQLLCTSSDEGGLVEGLGWVKAEVKHFKALGVENLKVPHMGWNSLQYCKQHYLNTDIADGSDVYFVHSHAVCCNDDSDVLTRTNYGLKFVSSFAKNNILGMQFHPEKSHRVGIQMLKNFVTDTC